MGTFFLEIGISSLVIEESCLLIEELSLVIEESSLVIATFSADIGTFDEFLDNYSLFPHFALCTLNFALAPYSLSPIPFINIYPVLTRRRVVRGLFRREGMKNRK